MTTRLICSCIALSLIPTLALGAERIWDNDLKRFLTEQEMSMAEVYLNEEESLKIMFPKSERVRKETIKLSPERKSLIE